MTAPESMTYDSLLLDISNYCERNDDPFQAQLPRFVMMAENKIAAEDKPLGFVRVVSGSLNSNVLAKPERWRKTKSFSILANNDLSYLFERGYEYCRSYSPTAGTTGQPRFYADYDFEHFFISPTPDKAYTFELSYYERPEPLSLTQQTNWTTQYAPQVLLYGCMVEAVKFLKLFELVPQWQGEYDRALGSIVKEDLDRTTDASEKRA